MERALSALSALAALALCAPACQQAEFAAVHQATEDEFYSPALQRVLELSLEWLGEGPSPAAYCVTIAPGYSPRELDQGRSPSPILLQSLHQQVARRTFHPLASCSTAESGRGGWTAPSGAPAGVLWVTPLDLDRQSLSGGWFGFPGHATGWICRFQEKDGVVKLEKCDLSWEA